MCNSLLHTVFVYHDCENVLTLTVHAWHSLSSHSQVNKKPERLVGPLTLPSYTSESVHETTAKFPPVTRIGLH